ncbi:MAG: guanylate kinase [Minisyncoccia bacterium]
MIVVVSGPSGVGKGALVEGVSELAPAIHVGVSCTTRSPRPGERDGVDYHFLSQEDFRNRVANDEFAEWQEVYEGKLYGTLKEELKHEVVLLEIECRGARVIKQRYPQTQAVFILPPTYLELERRLREREQGSKEGEVLERLAKAAQEIHQVSLFDFWIENLEIKDSIQRLWGMMQILHRKGKPSHQFFRCPTLLGRVQSTFPSNTASFAV